VSSAVGLSLNPSVSDFTDLQGIEHGPLLVMKLLVERMDITQINKIDKSVADITVILEINGQIEKIIVALELLVESLKHHFLRVLIGDIPYHQSRLVFRKYPRRNDLKLRVVINGLKLPLLALILPFPRVHVLPRKLTDQILASLTTTLLLQKTAVFGLLEGQLLILAAVLSREHRSLLF